jgi:hypothetical protein
MNMSISQSKEEPTLILTYDGDKVLKETIGFEGTDCVKETAFIMEARAKAVTSSKRTLKAEYTSGSKKVKTERIKL